MDPISELIYRIPDNEEKDRSVDIMGGARLLYLDLDVDFVGPVVGAVSSDTTKRIWNGVVGVRYTQQVTDKFFLWIYGDVGTGDSKYTWQAWGNAGYQLSERLSISVGYRYLDFVQESGGVKVDLNARGPIILTTLSF